VQKQKFNRENRSAVQKNPEIIIDIKDGEIEIEAFNISGPNCESIIEDLMQKLGQITNIEKKDDYYKKEQSIQEKNKQKV